MKLIKPYHRKSIAQLKAAFEIEGKKVLVLGCSTGVDCALLAKEGAADVVGVDLSHNTGRNFRDPRISYRRLSITDLSEIEDKSFDLVYSLAVFEHVFDLKNAFREAIRVVRRGGGVFITSGPLWYSPHGHHFKSYLEDFPWIHLVCSRKSILKLLQNSGCLNNAVEDKVSYLFGPKNFNRFPSDYYSFVCDALADCKILKNEFLRVKLNPNDFEYGRICLEYGFSIDDLVRSIHFFQAIRK